MKKNIACSYCKGKGYNTVMTGIRGDYCGVMNETCPKCNGTGVDLADMTNADRIRAMSDEELYLWAKKQIGCGFDFFPCGVVCDGKCESFDDETCKTKIMEWLKQPVEVADNG